MVYEGNTGFNLGMNFGEPLVLHILAHVHFIPRTDGDPGRPASKTYIDDPNNRKYEKHKEKIMNFKIPKVTLN